MNITNVKENKNFANGFDYFCVECGKFFSVKAAFFSAQLDIGTLEVEYCPYCGEDNFLDSISELIDYCDENDTDTVNFYNAFPPDELIPQSRTGATPLQVEWIVDCVVNDKEKKLPVTIKSLAAQLGYDKKVVAAVFEELYITETGENR